MIVVHHSGTPLQHVLCETEVDMLGLRAVTAVESPRTPLAPGAIGDPFGTPVYVGECPCAPDEVNEVQGASKPAETDLVRGPTFGSGGFSDGPSAPDEVNEAET